MRTEEPHIANVSQVLGRASRKGYAKSSFVQYKNDSVNRLTYGGVSDSPNLLFGHINRSKTAYEDLKGHLEHKHEVDAAVYFWNNPSALRYSDIQVLGQNKDMALPKNIKNIDRKRRRNFLAFAVYTGIYNNVEYEINTAVVAKGYEQMYFLKKKRGQRV